MLSDKKNDLHVNTNTNDKKDISESNNSSKIKSKNSKAKKSCENNSEKCENYKNMTVNNLVQFYNTLGVLLFKVQIPTIVRYLNHFFFSSFYQIIKNSIISRIIIR